MPETYTIKNVTEDLSFLVSLTKIFEVDNEGFWFDRDGKSRYTYQFDPNDQGKEIVVFQDPIPKGDYYIFNPFAEGIGKKSPATQLYYKTIRIALNSHIETVVKYIAQSLLEVKEANKANEEHSLSHSLMRVSSVPVDRKSTLYDLVDEKFISEIETLFSRTSSDLIFVPYLQQQMTANIKVDALVDPQWDEKFGKDIRKKSLAAFKSILMGILGINTPDELKIFTVKYDPDLKTSARFYTIMSVYLKIYSKFNDILADCYAKMSALQSRYQIDLDHFNSVLDRFPLAHSIAKHMIVAAHPKVHPTDTSTADTRGLQIGGTPGGSRRFPGPPVIDEFGRQSRGGNQSLQIGGPGNGPRRFSPHVVEDKPTDPFAPATRSMNYDSGGFGSSNSFGSSGGYFNGGFGGGMSQPSGGFNMNSPSNFGGPTQRRYFT